MKCSAIYQSKDVANGLSYLQLDPPTVFGLQSAKLKGFCRIVVLRQRFWGGYHELGGANLGS